MALAPPYRVIMPTLHELQTTLRRFIADGDPVACIADINESASVAADRLNIFRNNSLVAHTSVLAAVFPVVRKLVDPAFFAYLAHEFLRKHSPAHPCLSEYGCAFVPFLADFPALVQISYLEDVARLEWAVSRVASASRQESKTIDQFASCTGDAAFARLSLDSQVRFVASRFPIDRIWQMHQPGNEPVAADIEPGSAYLEIRSGRGAILRRLEQPEWIFRSLLAGGDELGVACETTLHFAPGFDLAGALARLFAEQLVVSWDFRR